MRVRRWASFTFYNILQVSSGYPAEITTAEIPLLREMAEATTESIVGVTADISMYDVPWRRSAVFLSALSVYSNRLQRLRHSTTGYLDNFLFT